jgi:hypothetical protein
MLELCAGCAGRTFFFEDMTPPLSFNQPINLRFSNHERAGCMGDEGVDYDDFDGGADDEMGEERSSEVDDLEVFYFIFNFSLLFFGV